MKYLPAILPMSYARSSKIELRDEKRRPCGNSGPYLF